LGAVEIAAAVGAVLAVAGAIGGVVRWAAGRFESQAGRLAKVEGEYALLYRDHSLLLVRLERFRLAFQMVASELSRKSPGNAALVHARALLDDAFTIEPDLPDDLKALVRRIDAESALRQERSASGRQA
jgi:hypothetical protein